MNRSNGGIAISSVGFLTNIPDSPYYMFDIGVHLNASKKIADMSYYNISFYTILIIDIIISSN